MARDVANRGTRCDGVHMPNYPVDGSVEVIGNGPRGAGAHADIEWVDVDDLVALAQIVTATAEAFCA